MEKKITSPTKIGKRTVTVTYIERPLNLKPLAMAILSTMKRAV